MRKVLVAGALASAMVVTGCQMNQETQRILGQVTGGIAGALAGSLVGDGTTRLIAMGVGAAAGTWLAGELFDALTEEDQEYAMDAVHQTASTGESISWHNPKTNVSGKTTILQTSYSKESVDLPVLKDKVQEVPELDMIGEDYRARSNSNVRGGPGTDYVVVDNLIAGQVVEVVGRVEGSNWVMVAQNGVGSGFVREDLLIKAPVQTAEQRSEVIRHRAKAQQEAFDTGLVEQVAVRSRSECREMEQEVVLDDGSVMKQSVKACRGPNGWQVA